MVTPLDLIISLFTSRLGCVFADASVMCTTQQDFSPVFCKSLFLDDLQVCPFPCE